MPITSPQTQFTPRDHGASASRIDGLFTLQLGEVAGDRLSPNRLFHASHLTDFEENVGKSCIFTFISFYLYIFPMYLYSFLFIVIYFLSLIVIS